MMIFLSILRYSAMTILLYFLIHLRVTFIPSPTVLVMIHSFPTTNQYTKDLCSWTMIDFILLQKFMMKINKHMMLYFH